MPLDDRVPRNASLGLLLRLASQHWTHAVESALAEAGFDGLRPPHSNVFTFTPPPLFSTNSLTGSRWWATVCNSCTFIWMLPSPARQTTRLPGRATAAPTAAGRS